MKINVAGNLIGLRGLENYVSKKTPHFTPKIVLYPTVCNAYLWIKISQIEEH